MLSSRKKSNNLVVRFRRVGHRFYPVYGIVVIRQNQGVCGRIIEKVGYYNPNFNERILVINSGKLVKWLFAGAKVNITVKKYIARFLYK